jgi:hypothetical protein
MIVGAGYLTDEQRAALDRVREQGRVRTLLLDDGAWPTGGRHVKGHRSPRRQQILALIEQLGEVTTKVVSARHGISIPAANAALLHMLAAKMVVRVGAHGSYAYRLKP